MKKVKKAKHTEFSKFRSIMAKLNNELMAKKVAKKKKDNQKNSNKI